METRATVTVGRSGECEPVTMYGGAGGAEAMFVARDDAERWAAELDARCGRFGCAAALAGDAENDPAELTVVGWAGTEHCCIGHRPQRADVGWMCSGCGCATTVARLVSVQLAGMEALHDDDGPDGWWVPVDDDVERAAEQQAWERTRASHGAASAANGRHRSNR